MSPGSFNPYSATLRRVEDPLREETRRVRKALLIWSLLAAATTLGGLFPSEVTALGMKVTPGNKAVLFGLVAAVVLYHLCTFLVYASADALHWYTNQRSKDYDEEFANYERHKEEALGAAKLSTEDREYLEQHGRRTGAFWRGEPSKLSRRIEVLAPYVSVARAVFDFLLPIVVGIGGFSLLVSASLGAA